MSREEPIDKQTVTGMIYYKNLIIIVYVLLINSSSKKKVNDYCTYFSRKMRRQKALLNEIYIGNLLLV